MGISIVGVVSTKLGLASHQNAVPLLRQPMQSLKTAVNRLIQPTEIFSVRKP